MKRCRESSATSRQTMLALLVAVCVAFVPVACLCDQASAAPRVETTEAPDHCHGAPGDRAPHRSSDHAADCAHCHSVMGPATPALVTAAPACQSTVLPSASMPVFGAGAGAHPRGSWRTERPPGHAVLRSKCVLQI
jgi:hypothetical protein